MDRLERWWASPETWSKGFTQESMLVTLAVTRYIEDMELEEVSSCNQTEIPVQL